MGVVGGSIRRAVVGVLAVAALVLAACGDDGDPAEATADGVSEGAEVETATDEADPDDVSADDAAAGEEADSDEEFDASVDPDRILTSITFGDQEYDIRDVTCDVFDHMFRVTGYIDTVHAGGDRIEVVDHEDRVGREVHLRILDEELDEEVSWQADGLAGIDGMTDGDLTVSGSATLELANPGGRFPDRDPETITFDLAC